ncbi:radical SAM protein [Uniformispora flossi]|uniref:radical SAM protein n=1 Tax=Uniformispora flossi TaxID=3390723 RepID=UPI003C2E3B54
MQSTSTDSDAARTDWTALQNYAALRGQLRVSFGPVCNIGCYFCHNEGDIPPLTTRLDRNRRPRRRKFEATDYVMTITRLMDAGLKRVYFTGGEPLVSPLARPVLEQLPAPQPDASYTLITNGTRIRRNADWLTATPLDKVKVSLHYFSDESFRRIAKTRLGICEVLDGIEAARERFQRVELNCLLLRDNAAEIPAILDYALTRRLPIQFIELVDTDYNGDAAGDALTADDVVGRLRNLTTDERIEIAGVGQGRRVFRVDGVEIDVIQSSLGRHHVGQCGTCPKRRQCVEGFWALRLDHAGALQPCLLREDLRLDVTGMPAESIGPSVAAHIDAFTQGVL